MHDHSESNCSLDVDDSVCLLLIGCPASVDTIINIKSILGAQWLVIYKSSTGRPLTCPVLPFTSVTFHR